MRKSVLKYFDDQLRGDCLINLFLNSLEKYRAFVIAFLCLISAFTSWGDNMVLTFIFVAGVIICPFIGIADIKEYKSKNS